jgi:DNA-binding NtrC family response regulator
MQRLLQHSFPGNVRELRNLVEQAVIHSQSEYADLIHFEPESHHLSGTRDSATLDLLPDNVKTLLEHERAVIEAALRKSKGNKAAAARTLGISRPALLRRISKARGISSPQEGG